jgi:hypothetical protein
MKKNIKRKETKKAMKNWRASFLQNLNSNPHYVIKQIIHA